MNEAAACDCWRLLGALEDEILPDHFSWEIAPEIVGRWVIETLAGREADHGDAFYDPLTTDGEDASDEVLASARWTGFQPNWPLRMDGRFLILVLRQWVQEQPSRTLATLLSRHPVWLEQVNIYGAVYARWRSHQDGHGDDADDIWINKPDQVWRSLGASQGDSPERVMALRLREAGLPDSPSTMRHLRGVVAGRSEPLPSHGVLIVTQVLMQGRVVERYGLEGVELYNPTTRISTAASDLVTGPLLDQVNEVIRLHRDWCREQFGTNSLADISAIRAAQPRSFGAATDWSSPDPFDYEVEGMRSLPDLLVALATVRGGMNREGMITAYLDKTYRRVRNRHQRFYQNALDGAADPKAVASLPEPQDGWRDMIRDVLNHDALKDILLVSDGRPPDKVLEILRQFADDLAAKVKKSHVTPLGGPTV